jgi:hypothetical protein
MTTPTEQAADLGARRARQYLDLAEAGRTDEAQFVLAAVSEPRDLVYVGAGFTALARMLARTLPPAMRAQASGRQTQLGTLRDRSRADVDGLRDWLRQAGEEVLTVARLAEPDPVARRRLLDLPDA